MTTNLLFLLFVGALTASAGAYLGSFMVLKRMSLVGDALSHVALPGIAIALSLGINPMLGALIALIGAVLGVWYLSENSEVYPESLVGIFFTAALSLGLILTPEPDLLEALFGNIDKVTMYDGIFIIFASFLIFVVTYLISKDLILGIVSEDLAKSQKINISRSNLIYLILVAFIVALGIKFLGTLLTGAIVIIPSAAAKNVARSIQSYYFVSIVVGIFSTIFGILTAKYFGISSGPSIVLIAVILFLFSLIFKK